MSLRTEVSEVSPHCFLFEGGDFVTICIRILICRIFLVVKEHLILCNAYSEDSKRKTYGVSQNKLHISIQKMSVHKIDAVTLKCI